MLDIKTASGLQPIDFTTYYSATWEVLNAALMGQMPELEQISDIPIVPDYAIANGEAKKKRKKSGKKGKKGKKGGKKKGKKKRKK